MTLEPVIRSALAVFLEHPGLSHRVPVIEGTLEQDLAQSLHHGAVRIALTIGKGMVLPMASDPFLGHNRGREPQPESHWRGGQRMEAHTAMRLRTVEKQGDADIGEMSRSNDEQYGHPPAMSPGSELGHCESPLPGDNSFNDDTRMVLVVV